MVCPLGLYLKPVQVTDAAFKASYTNQYKLPIQVIPVNLTLLEKVSTTP